jgi:hypothetical protein
MTCSLRAAVPGKEMAMSGALSTNAWRISSTGRNGT